MERGRAFIKAGQILDAEQKKRFREYIPDKVYKTERNISIIVAGTQLCMIVFSLGKSHGLLAYAGIDGYFVLYSMLFLVTALFLPIYGYLVRTKKYKAFFWLRRIYVILLYVWVIGITVLEQKNGMGIVIFCYLVPTLAAVLLLNPVESVMIFGISWVMLLLTFVLMGTASEDFMANLINSGFVTVLALFISLRYYRSLALEFRDRETISTQNMLLNKMAYTDQLTGLYNRRYLMEDILLSFQEKREKGWYAEFLMLDIDFFKQYNDTYGHLQGDLCLTQVGGIIRDCSPDTDTAAIRYGGEEFLLISFCPRLPSGELAKRIQGEMDSERIPRSDIPRGRVTLSIGIWQGALRDVESMEAAIHCADEALYRAKESGRNCVRYYESC